MQEFAEIGPVQRSQLLRQETLLAALVRGCWRAFDRGYRWPDMPLSEYLPLYTATSLLLRRCEPHSCL